MGHMKTSFGYYEPQPFVVRNLVIVKLSQTILQDDDTLITSICQPKFLDILDRVHIITVAGVVTR